SSVEKFKKSSTPETGAALFNNPTSSSNSDANTDEGNLIPVVLKEKLHNVSSFSSLLLGALMVLVGISSEGPDGSLRCCR
uniref:LTV1 ribosome biosis factor n=2 Tax=Canis lupus familiaris TaxID=9615 RepID=A0A8C0P636_CANLF